MKLPEFDTDGMIGFLTQLLNTPSPTGFTDQAVALCEETLSQLPDVSLHWTNKGALVATIPGEMDVSWRALTAHVDTLGAMVKEIKSNGRLKLSKLGGFAWNTVEGEGVTIFTRGGDGIRGSLLLTKPSAHVHGQDVGKTERKDDTMEVRLDARTKDADETRDLGISVGDFVTFDPRVEINNGFVRSRHLDDKACVACIIYAAKALAEAGLKPRTTTVLHISNYEEVGHGASAGIPPQVAELVSVDMAAVGEGQASDEFHATLCVKDSGGPYHYGLNQRMRELAEQYEIPHKIDIYPYYGSDGEAFWRAGGNVAVALIGPGVDASHNYERTHIEALIATTQWCLAYLLN
ncbi:MAG: M42 family metallopeptidase [Chloroflexota bacterium]|jgi:putative aminopeptidase FrvX|nr:M42 family metallopeptidase [Chloroflexota bacterium]